MLPSHLFSEDRVIDLGDLILFMMFMQRLVRGGHEQL